MALTIDPTLEDQVSELVTELGLIKESFNRHRGGLVTFDFLRLRPDVSQALNATALRMGVDKRHDVNAAAKAIGDVHWTNVLRVTLEMKRPEEGTEGWEVANVMVSLMVLVLNDLGFYDEPAA